MLPTFTNIASTLENQYVGIYDQTKFKTGDIAANLKKTQEDITTSFSDIVSGLEAFGKSAKNTSASANQLNDNIASIVDTVAQAGTITTQSVSDFENLLQTITGLGVGQGGLALNPQNPAGLAQAITGGATFLAGMQGIPAPLALLAGNSKEVTKGFYQLWRNLAASIPPGIDTDVFAAYLVTGFLPAI